MKYIVKLIFGVAVLVYIAMLFVTYIVVNIFLVLWHLDIKHYMPFDIKENFYDYGQEMDFDKNHKMIWLSYYEYYPDVKSWWKGKKVRIYI